MKLNSDGRGVEKVSDRSELEKNSARSASWKKSVTGAIWKKDNDKNNLGKMSAMGSTQGRARHGKKKAAKGASWKKGSDGLARTGKNQMQSWPKNEVSNEGDLEKKLRWALPGTK